jgi:hypothetical protein
MHSQLLERVQIVPVQVAGPADINGAAVTGDYVSLEQYRRCLVVLEAGDGTATSGDLTVAFYQATSNAGGDAKVLNALSTGRIFSKTHASSFAGVGTWTKETQATADEQWTDATSGEKVVLWAFEIEDQDLDADNGFDHIRMDISATSSSKIVSALYILYDAKHEMQPTNMLSAL